jgi:hypothetical protein
MTQIAVINHSTVINQTEFTAAVAAMQIQVKRDFAPIWGTPATVFDATHLTLPKGAWAVYILDTSDQPGALGYHDITAGLPSAKVFAKTCLDDNASWTVCLSHEITEALADPRCNQKVGIGGGRDVAREVGDPVEADEYGYRINGVLVSDFVTPKWFYRGTVGPFDFCKHLSTPLTLLPGGYASVYTPGQGWGQVNAENAPHAGRSARSWYRAVNEDVDELTILGSGE